MKKPQVKLVSADLVIPLRAQVLRPHQALKESHYKEDNDSTAFHLAVFDEHGKAICVGSFFPQSNTHFQNAEAPYRLRGMATAPEYRGQGLARELLLYGENLLVDKACDVLWFNARTSAEGFYLKLGFRVVGDIFDLPGIGPHKVMFKTM